MSMTSGKHVDTLKPGNVFRDWLVYTIGDRIHDKKCKTRVYKISASHTVCMYEFVGEDYGVVCKFYAEPTGGNRRYNPSRAMEREYEKLKKIDHIIDTPKPLTARKKFNCALVTEYVEGKPLTKYIKTEKNLYDKLTLVAHAARNLHDETKSDYRKDKEFARFHKVLDRTGMDHREREKFNHLLGKWWYSSRIDLPYGCMIHNDAHPGNYIFRDGKVYALDFESSWEHANPVHDLGVMAAELKKYFGLSRRSGYRAEHYIGHLLWNYSRSENEFYRIAGALPFFMSLGLLRMARWGLNSNHRDYLIHEAKACLKSL